MDKQKVEEIEKQTFEVDGILLTATPTGMLWEFRVGGVLHSFNISRKVMSDIARILYLFFPQVKETKAN